MTTAEKKEKKVAKKIEKKKVGNVEEKVEKVEEKVEKVEEKVEEEKADKEQIFSDKEQKELLDEINKPAKAPERQPYSPQKRFYFPPVIITFDRDDVVDVALIKELCERADEIRSEFPISNFSLNYREEKRGDFATLVIKRRANVDWPRTEEKLGNLLSAAVGFVSKQFVKEYASFAVFRGMSIEVKGKIKDPDAS